MKKETMDEVKKTFGFLPVDSDKLVAARRLELLMVERRLVELSVPFQQVKISILAIEAKYADGTTDVAATGNILEDHGRLVNLAVEMEKALKTWGDAFDLATKRASYKLAGKKIEDFFPPEPTVLPEDLAPEPGVTGHQRVRTDEEIFGKVEGKHPGLFEDKKVPDITSAG